MRNIYTCYLLTIAFLLSSIVNKSQVAVYTFSQFAGTYSPITGGTVFGNVNTDDEVFINPAMPNGVPIGLTGPGMPIGFNFLFNNVLVNRVGINANGFLMFGPSIPLPAIETQCSNAFTPISATSAVLPVHQSKVCAFGCDIQGQPGSEIRMETIGTTPNQTLVVQWKDYRKYNHVGDLFNFQIRVCETTNVIEVIYGACTNNSVASTCQVGLRGMTPLDYNNRFVNALNVWSASASGNSNASPANFNSSLIPANGQVYRWMPPPPCSTAPPPNSVLATPPTICPGGSSTLNIAVTYSLTGLTYAWQSSTTSSLGPYTAIPNGTNAVITESNVNVNTWYNCIVTCSSVSSSITTSPFQVQTTGVVLNSIPYSEGFENIIVNNQLPNCSWAASNPTNICQTYVAANTLSRFARTGNKFASFRFSTNPAGDYFYTNGLQLNAGITYSFSVWYLTDYLGSIGWSNFSVLLGPNQSTTGLNVISNLTGPIVTPVYKSLSNTFTVASSGVYYMALKCIGSASANYFSWDDLEITIPCQLNSPNLNVTASSVSLCAGQSLSITTTGADTFTWNTGPVGSIITDTPQTSTVYSVTGTNSLTGCSSTASINITVSQTPAIAAFANKQTICKNEATFIQAIGATSYSWNNGNTGPILSVSPSITTIYTLQGTSAEGCTSQTTVEIVVKPLPNLTITASPASICVGETATLICSGALNYSWTANGLYLKNNLITVNPKTNTSYTVYGMDANGCLSDAVSALSVNACVQLNEISLDPRDVEIFPNPASSCVNVNIKNSSGVSILLSDLTGRVLYKTESAADGFNIVNMSELCKGLYLITIKSNSSSVSSKILKD